MRLTNTICAIFEFQHIPSRKTEVIKIKRHANKYIIDDGKLDRKTSGGALLRCLGTIEANKVHGDS